MIRKEENICLLDCLGVCSLFKLIKLRNQSNITEVWYCSTTKLFKLIQRSSVFKKVFSIKFKQFNYEIGVIYSKNKQGIVWQWAQDTSFHSVEIMKKTMKDSFVLDRLNHRYNKDKIQLFLTPQKQNYKRENHKRLDKGQTEQHGGLNLISRGGISTH